MVYLMNSGWVKMFMMLYVEAINVILDDNRTRHIYRKEENIIISSSKKIYFPHKNHFFLSIHHLTQTSIQYETETVL